MTPKQRERMLRNAETAGRFDAVDEKRRNSVVAFNAIKKRWWPAVVPDDFMEAYNVGYSDALKLNDMEEPR